MDIWGGKLSENHVARYILSIDEALSKSKSELIAGYLINLRCDLAWGDYSQFDDRKKQFQ